MLYRKIVKQYIGGKKMAQAINLMGMSVYLTESASATSPTGLDPIVFSRLSGVDSKTNSFVTYYDCSESGGGFAKKVGTVSDCGQLQIDVPAEAAGDLTIFDTIDAQPAHNGRIFVKYSTAIAALYGKAGVYADVILTQKQLNEVNENGYTGGQFTFEVSGKWNTLTSGGSGTS
jgi:hypothetical protein